MLEFESGVGCGVVCAGWFSSCRLFGICIRIFVCDSVRVHVRSRFAFGLSLEFDIVCPIASDMLVVSCVGRFRVCCGMHACVRPAVLCVLDVVGYTTPMRFQI